MRFLTRLFLLPCSLLVALPEAWSALPENEVRAAIVVNFMHYVEWPDNPPPATGLLICVAGLGSTADTLLGYSGKSVHGRRVLVESRAYSSSANRDCRVLFIGETGIHSAASWLRNVSGQAVLTISEGDDFLANGGIVSLHRVGSRVGFDVNLAAMRRSNLRISSQLLRLARDVQGK